MIRKDEKTAVIEANRTHPTDTGSPEVQIANRAALCSHINRTCFRSADAFLAVEYGPEAGFVRPWPRSILHSRLRRGAHCAPLSILRPAFGPVFKC